MISFFGGPLFYFSNEVQSNYIPDSEYITEQVYGVDFILCRRMESLD